MAVIKLCLLLLAVGVPLVAGNCPPIPTVAHASAQTDPAPTTNEGSEVTYTCEPGYEFNFDGSTPQYTITCGTDGQWDPISDCTEIYCPTLPSDAILSSTNYNYQAVVTMSCTNNTYYRIPGVDVGLDLTVTCTGNKTWDLWDSTEPKGCVPIECANPMSPNSVGSNPSNAVGQVSEYVCNEGYYFDVNDLDLASVIVQCNANGDWEDVVTPGKIDWQCHPVQCKSIIDYYNLTRVTVNPKTSFVGDEVTIACMDGHEFNDSSIEKKINCWRNQTWDFVPFDCEAKVCPPVANISKANISTFDNWYPTVVNFTCDPGYYFPDGSLWRTSECNKYGKWSVAIPNCGDKSDIESDFSAETYDVEGAASYSIIAGVIVLILVIAIIVLDILTFGRQISFLKTNLGSRFECMRPKVEELDELDGDEVMRASTISLGRGRITPAASTVDLQQYGDKSKQSQLNTLEDVEDVEIVNEELRAAEEEAPKKSLIPRTRLASAKSSIQRAVSKATGADMFRTKMMTTIRKNQFASTGLPLGAQNYGKIVEMRPPSPAKEEDVQDSSDEYTDDDSEDEENPV